MEYRFIVLVLLFGFATALENRGETTPCCNVQICADQIPKIDKPQPVYELCEQVVVPPDYLDSIIGNVSPGSTLAPFGTQGASAAYEDDTLIAFVRPDTGESRVFPSFQCLTPGKDLVTTASAVANQFIGNTALFPPDDTTLVALPPVTLSGSQSTSPGNASAPEQLAAFVRIQRQINGIPVEGPGTQAAIVVNSDGCIIGFAHRYRPAFITDKCVAPHSPDMIVEAIKNDLSDTCTVDNVTISNVIVSYWDSGNNYIQPVYRYAGQIPAADNATEHSQLTGSISIGTEPESLTATPTQDFPSNESPGFHSKWRRGDDGGNRTVGRYVVRDDSLEWIDSATAFYSNLQIATTLGSPFTFIDKQYLSATPSIFVSDKDSYVNTVQIALNEVHGDWGEFTTFKNYGDIVTLIEIAAAGGLGYLPSGLAYWILHSCEVIPTQTDESTSFDVWWKIFKGLHSVVGYRTDIWINDGVTTNFGLWVGLGAPIVPAWFLELAVNPEYETSDAVYLDVNRNIDEPLGRASSVSVCGHLDDTIKDVDSLGNATCLFELWFDN